MPTFERSSKGISWAMATATASATFCTRAWKETAPETATRIGNRAPAGRTSLDTYPEGTRNAVKTYAIQNEKPHKKLGRLI